jgi:hypothetical protein
VKQSKMDMGEEGGREEERHRVLREKERNKGRMRDRKKQRENEWRLRGRKRKVRWGE